MEEDMDFGTIGPILLKVIINMVYAVGGVLIGVWAMKFGFVQIDKLTPFNTSELLENGNIAVGKMINGLFIGIGFVVGMIIGLSIM